VGHTEYHKLRAAELKMKVKMKDSVLGLLSEGVRGMGRSLKSDVSLGVAASTLVCTIVIAVALLLAYFVCRLIQQEDVGSTPGVESGSEGATEVWSKINVPIPHHHTINKIFEQFPEEAKKLLGLWHELDNISQGPFSPDGFISLEDLHDAMEDARVMAIFIRCGICLHDSKTLFLLLDKNKDGVVDLNEFITGCHDMLLHTHHHLSTPQPPPRGPRQADLMVSTPSVSTLQLNRHPADRGKPT